MFVPLTALSILGKASMDNPSLGFEDINNFAIALQGFRYKPRVLAVLQVSIKKMIEKDLKFDEDQALFCFRGLEHLQITTPRSFKKVTPTFPVSSSSALQRSSDGPTSTFR